MMAFGIVVIASQIGTGDVGDQVLAGLQKLDAKLAVLCRVLHRVRGDRARPHHHRRTQRVKHGRRIQACGSPIDGSCGSARLVVVVRRCVVARRCSTLPDFPSWRIGIGSWAESVDRLAQRRTSAHGVPDHRWHGFDQRLHRPRRPRSAPRRAAGCGLVVRGAGLRRARLAQRRLAARNVLCGGPRRHRGDGQLGPRHGHAEPGARSRSPSACASPSRSASGAAARGGSRRVLRPFLDTAQVLPAVRVPRAGRVPVQRRPHPGRDRRCHLRLAAGHPAGQPRSARGARSRRAKRRSRSARHLVRSCSRCSSRWRSSRSCSASTR